jgi:hypothetical protein
MHLRPHPSLHRPPPRWVLAVLAGLAVAVVSLGRASPPADAGTYSSTLYLSGTSSSVVSGGYQLVAGQGVSTTSRPAPGATIFCASCGGNLGPASATAYSYEYTLVDAGGGTAPSAVGSSSAVLKGEITVSGLPTGVTVRLYRSTSAVHGPWKLVVELPNNSSQSYLDNVADASLGALLPQAQTRTTASLGTGYYEYAPGNALSDTNTNGDFAKVSGGSPVFDNEGWVVDGPGGVSFAAGSWSVTVKITSAAGNGIARLDVGMWIVNDAGSVVGSALIDPTCASSPCSSGVPGENGSANIATVAGTSAAIPTNFLLPAFSLARDQHLYVQFWRHQTAVSSSNTISTLAAYDGTAAITHPAENAFPNVPALSSVAARVNTTPPLSATFSDPDGSDTGTLSFQICSDQLCNTVIDSSDADANSPSGLSSNPATYVPWTTPSINLADKTKYPDGTYYWRVQATDNSPARNVSGWSNASSFVVDTVPPTVSNVTSSANGAYKAGAPVPITVRFSEPVTVDTSGGTPTLALSNGATATYASSSGTDLTFTYIVGSGDTNTTHLAYAATTPLVLHGATIRDAAHNDATLTLPSPGSAGSLDANTTIAVDTIPPTVTSVTSTQASGSYKAGTVIPVTVNFSEPVVVTGTPTLALNTAPAENATYSSGSGTSALVFNYTVQAGDNVAALDYTGTGALNGGTIADPAGNNAILTLASPGAAGSLAANKSIRIDTNPPGIPSLTGPADASYLGATPTLSATFSNSDAGDSGTLDFQVCSDSNCTAVVKSGSSAGGLHNGDSGNWTPSGLADGTYYWQAGGVDAAGNQSAWSAPRSFTLDTTPPTAPALGTIAARINNKTPQLSATFSDPGATDSGTLAFQLCSDSSCTSVLQNSTQSGIADNATAHWAPSSLADRVYYWRVQATDSAGNQSSWASAGFVVDTVPPGAPTLDSPAAAARVNTTKLGATFVDSDSSDSGTVTFELCSDAACSTVVGSPSTSATVSGGTAVSWTPTGVTDGTYYWRLRATDAAGNQTGWTATRSFVLDTNPPGVPSLNSPADAAYLGASPALSATFSSSDVGDSGTLDFQVCSDSGCTAVVKSGSSAGGILSGGSGSWTPSGLADGTYYWQASAVDAAGNQSASSATRSFTLDTTPPTAPALGTIAARINNTTPQLSATFSDPGAADSGTLSFQLCSNSSCTTVLQSNTTGAVADGANGNWTPGSLADGTYYWRVRATDTAGNVSAWSAASSFVVDTVAPGPPAFVSPAAAGRVNSSQLQATFVDSDPTDSGTVTFQLCSDAACSAVLASSTSLTVAGGTGASWTPGGLADGTYYWRLSGLDVAGNQGAWTATRSFVLDTNPPGTPSLTSPADAAYLGAAPALSATFSSSDVGDSGTVSFQVCSDSGCTAVVQSGSSASGLTNGASGSWTPSGLADSGYYWHARATDAAGNQSGWSAVRSFTLDTGPPSVPVQTAPGNGARFNQPSSLNATYADAAGDAGSVIFQVCTTSACTTVAASTTVTGVLDNAGAGWTPGSLRDGTYYWRARAQDSAGNQSAWSSVRSFTIDSTPPAAPVLVGFAGVHVRTAPALTALVDDPGDPADKVRLLVELCTDPACTQVVTTGYSGSVPVGTLAGWQAPKLSDGPYYWRARAEDLVGNQSPWSAVDSFVVDSAAPTVPAAAGPAVGAIVNTARLSAAVTGLSRGGGSGIEFQVCADAACTKVVASGYVPVPASGAVPTWTPTGLRDGSYFWRLSAHDQAGNESAWSETMSFVLDQTPPGTPRLLQVTVTGRTLMLRWQAPALAHHLVGYTLLVNGKRMRTLTLKTHTVRIQLRKSETRLFAVASVDAAGNVSRPTRQVAADSLRLANRTARGAASPQPRRR